MNKQSHLNIFSVALSLTLTMSPVAQAAHAEGTSVAPDKIPAAITFSPLVVPKPGDVLQVLERSAAAQIGHMKDIEANSALIGPGRWPVSVNWVTATFFVGAAKLARVSDDASIYEYSLHLADRFQRALRGQGTPVALLNADDQAIGALYEEIYARRQFPGTLMPLKQRLDFAVPYLTKIPAPRWFVWW